MLHFISLPNCLCTIASFLVEKLWQNCFVLNEYNMMFGLLSICARGFLSEFQSIFFFIFFLRLFPSSFVLLFFSLLIFVSKIFRLEISLEPTARK